MSKISLDTWSNPEYRKKQVESHKKFAYNNPDKIRAGNHGILKCSKSNKGELIYDSSWEQLFIILCENLDFVTSINRVSFSIQYKYQKEYFMYFPDFDVTLSNGKRLMIELKANWMIEKDKKTPLKLKAGEDYVKESTEFDYFVLLTEDQLFLDKKLAKQFDKNGITSLLNKYNSIL